MTGRQQDVECYVNLYKDVHGVKPRHMGVEHWTDAELQDAIRYLSERVEAELAAERARFQSLADSLGVSLDTFERWEREAWLST